jgi:hypothetical protein
VNCPPPHEPFPLVDEHLVVPEVTRDEPIRGRKVIAQPAELRMLASRRSSTS